MWWGIWCPLWPWQTSILTQPLFSLQVYSLSRCHWGVEILKFWEHPGMISLSGIWSLLPPQVVSWEIPLIPSLIKSPSCIVMVTIEFYGVLKGLWMAICINYLFQWFTIVSDILSGLRSNPKHLFDTMKRELYQKFPTVAQAAVSEQVHVKFSRCTLMMTEDIKIMLMLHLFLLHLWKTSSLSVCWESSSINFFSRKEQNWKSIIWNKVNLKTKRCVS